MRHLKYLSYVVRHKWFVLIACWRRGLIWQGIVHDWSKFLPSEWIAYADFFYGPKYSDAEREQASRLCIVLESKESLRARFNRAWLRHQHRSPHHWQHWVLRNDDGTTVVLEMPRRYVLEMLADWDGAGRAITGKSGGTPLWYAKNCEKMLMHPNTRAFVDAELRYDEFVPV